MKMGKKRGRNDLQKNFRQGDRIMGLDSFREPYFKQLDKAGFEYIAAHQLNLDHALVEHFLDDTITTEYRRSLPSEQQKFLLFLEKNKTHLLRSGGKCAWKYNNDREFRFGVVIRRICKLIITKSTPEHRSHFILDGISQEDVCKKQRRGKYSSAITSAELRAAFREKNPNVFFYIKGNKTAEPWTEEEQKMNYEQYQEVREKKRRKTSR